MLARVSRLPTLVATLVAMAFPAEAQTPPVEDYAGYLRLGVAAYGSDDRALRSRHETFFRIQGVRSSAFCETKGPGAHRADVMLSAFESHRAVGNGNLDRTISSLIRRHAGATDWPAVEAVIDRVLAQMDGVTVQALKALFQARRRVQEVPCARLAKAYWDYRGAFLEARRLMRPYSDAACLWVRDINRCDMMFSAPEAVALVPRETFRDAILRARDAAAGPLVGAVRDMDRGVVLRLPGTVDDTVFHALATAFAARSLPLVVRRTVGYDGAALDGPRFQVLIGGHVAFGGALNSGDISRLGSLLDRLSRLPAPDRGPAGGERVQIVADEVFPDWRTAVLIEILTDRGFEVGWRREDGDGGVRLFRGGEALEVPEGARTIDKLLPVLDALGRVGTGRHTPALPPIDAEAAGTLSKERKAIVLHVGAGVSWLRTVTDVALIGEEGFRVEAHPGGPEGRLMVYAVDRQTGEPIEPDQMTSLMVLLKRGKLGALARIDAP